MIHTPRIHVFMGCSLDGFIAGKDHDIAWLEADRSHPDNLPADAAALSFESFMQGIGAMLMGRTTYDVVSRMGLWPYGETPVLVATTRPLDAPRATVTAVSGDIDTLIATASAAAGARDVYLDGGDLVRQALNAGRVDTLTATIVPVLLGEGVRLFDGLVARHALQFLSHASYGGGLVQLRARFLRS